MLNRASCWIAGLVCVTCQAHAFAQTPTDTAILKGLAPVSALSQTKEGQAALGANYVVTGAIQTGSSGQQSLLPFPEQQQLALRDVFSTRANLVQLADGLGTTLAAAYTARAHYVDRSTFTSISSSLADLIAYADATSREDATSAKFFLGNATSNGTTPISIEAAAIFAQIDGAPDVFGRAYGRAAGTPGADRFGNSRPFQTEPSFTRIIGPDYFNSPADNYVYNRGPMMDLGDSPSFPSGHTTYGYTGALLLAILVPERYQQMIVRGAEYGNGRIIVGAHYAMDVLAGRSLALYDVAHLLANDRGYIGRTLEKHAPINNFQQALTSARKDLVKALEGACGGSIEECALEDNGRFSNVTANEAFYASTQTYSLPVAYPKRANVLEDVAELAPEAGYLLTLAFPSLSLREADEILTETEGPGGGFLDNGSSFGIYSRLNLYAASGMATYRVSSRSHSQVPTTQDKASGEKQALFTRANGIVYTEGMHGPLFADMFLPKTTGLRPAIVYLHGGGWKSGDRTQLQDVAISLAEKGYVGMAVDYDSTAQGDRFPVALHESEEAVAWLRRNAVRYGVAPDRIAVAGSSAGGELAALLALDRHPLPNAKVQAAIIFNGVLDLSYVGPDAEDMVEPYLGGTCVMQASRCHSASPVFQVHPQAPPFYVGHGTADRIVPYSQAEHFVQLLRTNNVAVTPFIAVDAGHTYWKTERWYQQNIASLLDFLQKELPNELLSPTASKRRPQ